MLCLRGGALLNFRKLIFTAIIAACCTTVALADGIDPKVIIQKGGGSIPITLTNPNPTFSGQASLNPNCLNPSVPCVYDVFQNQLGTTLTSLTIFIATVPNLVFTCGDQSLGLYFDHCGSTTVSGGTDISFTADGLNGFNGVGPATQQCVADSDPFLGAIDKFLFSLKGGCQKWDPDDYKYVGGEFSVDIEGADMPLGTTVGGSAITTPEPATGLLLLLGALTFAGVLATRKSALNAA